MCDYQISETTWPVQIGQETITANNVSWNEIIHWELEIVCLGHCQDSCEMPKDSLFMT